MLSFLYSVSYGRHNVYLSKDVTLARYKSYEARRMLSFQYIVSYGRHNVYLSKDVTLARYKLHPY
jgi:hypothetical protein